MNYEYAFDTFGGQDGAIYGDRLFRFDADGSCRVYATETHTEVARFTLSDTERWMPHSNAVMFGTEKYEEGDPFPLLYTNVYNNYEREDDRREGVLCVYRVLVTDDGGYSAPLVGIIRIGFVEDRTMWKSLDGKGDVRPYGNFVIDREQNRLYAFVMRDGEHVTRYFSFVLPTLSAGTEADGLRVVTLMPDDILSSFDASYMRYMQGACAKDGVIYSVEGFGPGANPARMQVIDMRMCNVTHDIDLDALGLTVEPEFIDFCGEDLYYSDATGRVYRFTL